MKISCYRTDHNFAVSSIISGPLPEATLTESDRRIMSDLVGFGWIWSDSFGFGRIWPDFDFWLIRSIWSDSVGFGRIWTDSVGFGRIRSDSVRFGRISSDLVGLVGFGRIRSDLVGVTPGRGPSTIAGFAKPESLVFPLGRSLPLDGCKGSEDPQGFRHFLLMYHS